MKYENPDIPEGINLTPVNPLRELARLFSGLMLVITVTIVTLSYLAGSLAQHIPFAWESRLLENPINQLMASRLPRLTGTARTQQVAWIHGNQLSLSSCQEEPAPR